MVFPENQFLDGNTRKHNYPCNPRETLLASSHTFFCRMHYNVQNHIIPYFYLAYLMCLSCIPLTVKWAVKFYHTYNRISKLNFGKTAQYTKPSQTNQGWYFPSYTKSASILKIQTWWFFHIFPIARYDFTSNLMVGKSTFNIPSHQSYDELL